ncbi:hypothetical protein amb1727 [Paramagnetospirillum magneticum AMB-1]|uniref:Uncharacterized protein n=1 Tax=Paramagnetospirillum magneticum (strain ATCC 700264 / AMB-1) TaxID=342108 RepID=Q2W6J4_PARM1|nr:hypothetical protein amb1727 [Paramagnetospirillum magneticum AMB-1]
MPCRIVRPLIGPPINGLPPTLPKRQRRQAFFQACLLVATTQSRTGAYDRCHTLAEFYNRRMVARILRDGGGNRLLLKGIEQIAKRVVAIRGASLPRYKKRGKLS